MVVMTVVLKLDTTDSVLASAFEPDTAVEVGGGLLKCEARTRSLGAQEIVLFTLSIPANVAASVAASEIVEYFRRKTGERHPARPERDDVTRIAISPAPGDPSAWIEIRIRTPMSAETAMDVEITIRDALQKAESGAPSN